ncbi:MAG: hypothetical protein ACFFCS_08940 [Candidatus Hodarchaeota archaeon]
MQIKEMGDKEKDKIAAGEMNATDKEYIKSMRKYYFSTGIGDGTSTLCRANMVYGLAKIHLVQKELGMETNAHFISTPDETISRNVGRWNSGFGYGGKLSWGNGSEKVVILDVKPNYCGILVGGLESIPKPEDLISRIHDFLLESFFIDNFKLQSDFSKSNHFIDLFELAPFKDMELPTHLPPYVFFIHGSCPELRDANDKGPGLYWNHSNAIQEMQEELNTHYGKIHYLLDDNAKKFLQYCEYADAFSKKKRKIVADFLFGDFKEISNPTHQGLLNYNTILLGAQNTLDPSVKSNIFPIALRGDLPAYLFSGRPNMNQEVIENLGFTKRAEKLGLMDNLLNVNIIPHGGGYRFSEISEATDVFTVKGRRYFVCEMENDMGKKIVEEVSALEFSYRGKDVMRKTRELELGNPVAKLIPKYVLKI